MNDDSSHKSSILGYLNKLNQPWKFLAPMVGNSDESYRILAKKYGADLCYTEMVNCKIFNVNRCNPVINQWYTTSRMDKPLVIQICGDNPDVMAETCRTLDDYCDAIDINFGCPQEIARKSHYGSFLQDEWDLIEQIVSSCVRISKVPIFCKIRVFESIEKTVKYAKIFENAGASLITVHGRTREQKGENTGLANWDHIKAVKAALRIPVIANGNIVLKKDIDECFMYTNCDGVMSAETHLHDPCIFYSDDLLANVVFKEYLRITEEVLNYKPEDLYGFDLKPIIEMGSVKSHAFKIFRNVFRKLPDYREILNKCKKLSDYYIFVENLENLLEIGVLKEEDLRMGPNIR